MTMKYPGFKVKLIAVSILSALVALMVAFPLPMANADIAGSAHDFSGAGYGTDEICKFCHIPHNATTTLPAPLWNHAQTTETFTMYGDPNNSIDHTPAGAPGGVSLLCLSCHDGVTNVDAFGGTGAPPGVGTTPIAGSAVMGIDLSNDHPISFTYDSTLVTADGGLNAITDIPIGLGGSIEDKMLYGGKVECSSCHDVHNGTGNPLLLRLPISGSDLCLSCHNK